jgi:hypothetical protein
MADNESKHILKYQVDQASARAVQEETARIEARMESLAKATRTIGTSAATASSALRRIDDSQLAHVRKSALAAQVELDDLRASMEGVNDEAERGARTANYNPGNRLMAVSQLANRAGASGAGQGLAIGDDILDAAEAAQTFKAHWPEMVDEISGAIPGVNALSGGLQKLVPNLSTAAAQTVALGAAAAVVTAVGFGINYIVQQQEQEHAARRQQYQEDRQNMATALAQQREYTRLVLDATTAQAQSQIERLQNEIAFKNAQKAQYTEIFDIVDSFSGMGAFADDRAAFELQARGIREFNGQVIENGASIAGIRDDYTALNSEIGQLEGELKIWNDAITNGGTASNDAAAQHEAYRQALIQSASAVAQSQIDLAQQEREWSTEQVQNRLSDIATERQALESQMRVLQLFQALGFDTTQETKALTNQLTTLKTEESNLTGVVLVAATAREKQAGAERLAIEVTQANARAVINEKKAREDELEAMEETRKKRDDLVASYDDETGKITAQRELSSNREIEDYLRARASSIAQHYKSLAALDKKYYEDQAQIIANMQEAADESQQETLKALADYNKESIRLTEDHQDRILDIERRMSRGIEDAVLARDVTAALNAVRQGEDDLSAEDKQYTKEARRRDEDFQAKVKDMDRERQARQRAAQQALQDLQRRYQEERQATIAAFNQQQQQEDTERRIKLQRQQQDWQIEDNLRRQQHQAQLNDLTSVSSAEVSLRKSFHAAILADVDSFGKGLKTAYANANAGMGITKGDGGITKGIPYGGKYADGGYPPPGTMVKVGERGTEGAMFMGNWRIFPNDQMKSAGGNSFNVDLRGSTFGGGDSAGAIEAVFEQVILPKMVRAVQGAGQTQRAGL